MFCLVVMNKILGTWLSMCIIVDSFCVNPSSFSKFHNHIAFLMALLIAIYLISVVDNASCRLFIAPNLLLHCTKKIRHIQ